MPSADPCPGEGAPVHANSGDTGSALRWNRDVDRRGWPETLDARRQWPSETSLAITAGDKPVLSACPHVMKPYCRRARATDVARAFLSIAPLGTLDI